MSRPARLLQVFGRSAKSHYDDLNRICATTHHGCMGLPPKLVYYILGLLRGDFQTLKACSLTCKSMFASTQPFIHETLRLTRQNNESVLTKKQKKELHLKPGHHELRFMSYMAERGLLQYTRGLDIRDPVISTPGILLPHLHHFQSLT